MIRVVQLDPSKSIGGGRGCVATCPIAAGQVLLLRRSADTLHRGSPNLCAQSQLAVANEGDDARPIFDDKIELAVLLMLERAMGSASHFAPYIAELPADFSCLPDEWDLDTNPLPSLTRSLLLRRRDHVAAMFRDSVEPWCARSAPEVVVTLSDFRWALNAVSSRAQWWNSNQCPAMVPLGDMINHSNAPNAAFGAKLEVSMRLRSVGVAPSQELADGADIDEWFCAALRDIAEGEQVFIEYSDDTCDLFLNYGIPPAGDGGAVFPLPTHATVAPQLLLSPATTARLPDLLEEEITNDVIFIANSPLGFQRVFDAYRIALAPTVEPATFAAVRAGRAIASDEAAAKAIADVCAQLLAETASLVRDDLGQRACWQALSEHVKKMS